MLALFLGPCWLFSAPCYKVGTAPRRGGGGHGMMSSYGRYLSARLHRPNFHLIEQGNFFKYSTSKVCDQILFFAQIYRRIKCKDISIVATTPIVRRGFLPNGKIVEIGRIKPDGGLHVSGGGLHVSGEAAYE